MLDINDLFPNGLSVSDAINLLQPVTLYVFGVAVYAVFVFNFYRFVALRDMFKFDVYRFDESRYRALRSFLHIVSYTLKYLIVFPLFAFFWFAVLTLMLTFLSKSRDFADTLLIALATVSAIRFSAYYDEDLARDLAKILPFALLALFLIDASFFNFVDSLEMLDGGERPSRNGGLLPAVPDWIGVRAAFRLRIQRVALHEAASRGRRRQEVATIRSAVSDPDQGEIESEHVEPMIEQPPKRES